MISEEARNAPGGPIALFLFLLGLAGLLSWAVLRGVTIGEGIPGAWHWLVLGWSIAAVALAVRLRKSSSMRSFAAYWLFAGMIGAVLLIADRGTYF